MSDPTKSDPDLVAELRGLRIEGGGIRADLDELKKKQGEDRRTLRVLSALMVAKLVTLVLLVVVVFQVVSLIDRIDDCLSADGECAQRNAASIQLVILSASYQTEVQRLTTEIRVGERTGQNAESLRVRRERLAEVSAVLQRIGENLKDVREGRTPRNQIPTELAQSVPEQENP